jgi:hypothetical protein
MSVSKTFLRDEESCRRAVEFYLSPSKPTASQVAELLKTTEQNINAVLNERLSKKERLSENALRYSRSKMGDKNPMLGKTGETHHNFKGDLFCDPEGYVLVLRPKWYTNRVANHVYQHSVVMCDLLGMSGIPAGMHVHHIDGVKTNNDPSNLALVTASGHRRIHARSPLKRLSLWELHRSGTSKLKPTTPTLPTG